MVNWTILSLKYDVLGLRYVAFESITSHSLEGAKKSCVRYSICHNNNNNNNCCSDPRDVTSKTKNVDPLTQYIKNPSISKWVL